MVRPGGYDIHFEQHRSGSIIAWDSSSNFIALELIPDPYPGPLLVCIFEPRCPQVFFFWVVSDIPIL